MHSLGHEVARLASACCACAHPPTMLVGSATFFGHHEETLAEKVIGASGGNLGHTRSCVWHSGFSRMALSPRARFPCVLKVVHLSSLEPAPIFHVKRCLDVRHATQRLVVMRDNSRLRSMCSVASWLSTRCGAGRADSASKGT
eukprot:2360223-Amphidinium_carterae.2